MATLPAATTYWRVKGSGDSAWTLDADGTFTPTAGATVEVVTVGPSPIAQIVADTTPAISGLADLSASYGASVTINAALMASGSNLVYAITGPSWLSINSATGQITGTAPSSDAATTATVTVSNGGGSASRTFAVTVTSGAAFGPHDLSDSTLNVSASMGSALNTAIPALVTYHGGTPHHSYEFIGESGLEQFWELPQEQGIDARAKLAEGTTDIFIMSDLSNGNGDQIVIDYGIKWLDLANEYGADPYFYKLWNSRMPGTAGASWDTWYQGTLYRKQLWDWVVAGINAGRRPGTRPVKVVPFNDVHLRVYNEIVAGTAPAELISAAAANGVMMIFHGKAGTYTDGHPSDVGAYVIATTVFCTVYQRQSTMPFASMYPTPDKTITEATATWLRGIIWEVVQAEPLNGFGGDGWVAPEYGVRADALDSLTIYRAPAGATSFDLRNQAGAVTTVAASALPQTIALSLGGHDDAIEVRANNSANWSPAVPVMTQGSSPVQIVAADWYQTANSNAGMSVVLPAGIQNGDVVAFIGLAANNTQFIWGNPGSGTKPSYYNLVPNRVNQVLNSADTTRRISMNCSWGIYNSATWPASFADMALIAYTHFCVLVIRGTSSFSLGGYAGRSAVALGSALTRTFDYPELATPPQSLIVEIAAGRYYGNQIEYGSPLSGSEVVQHVNPPRLDEDIMNVWRYSTLCQTTTRRIAKSNPVPAQTREFPGYSYIQTGVFSFVAAP